MDWITQLLWHHDRLLGIEWHVMKVIGWVGNLAFSSRFFVQWWATEKHKHVVVPPVFWWLSLFGSGCLIAYGVYRRDSVFIFAYVFTWIPYVRNLVISRRAAKAQLKCSACRAECPPRSCFCLACGARLGAISPPG
jgi:lipid-A-disaccharide synthase-like uncharacterized protein